MNENDLKSLISEILFYVWDPLSLSPDPYARKEYDGPVYLISQILLSDTSLSEKVMKIDDELTNTLMNDFEITEGFKNDENVPELLIRAYEYYQMMSKVNL